MSKLIGTEPNQVPSNADLGTMAYQDADSVNLGTLLSTKKIAIDTNGTDTLNSPYLFTVADEAHGVAMDYINAYPTKPGGLFSTAGGSTWPFNQYGNLILTTRTDYGGYYDIALVTASSNNTPVPRLVVKSSGNVGIGTDSPRATLEVGDFANTSGLVTEQLFITGRYVGSDGTFAQIRLSNSNDAGGDFAEIGARRESDNYGTRLYFATNPAGNTNSLATRMTIRDNGNVGINTTTPDYLLTTNGGTAQIGVQISETDRLTIGADGTWNYYAAKSGNGHRFTTTGGGTVLDVLNGGNVHIDGDIVGNEPSQRGRLRILNAGGETSDGGLEFHTSNAGGAGYGARITSDTSGRMYIQTRSNASSWTTQQTFDASGFGSEIEGYDFTSSGINLAPPFNSRKWSNVTFNGASATYTTALFNNRLAHVIRLQNTDSTHWNFTRYDGLANDSDYNVPGSENYAVFEFWSKNNGGSTTSYRGFIAEGDYWAGSPSRTSSTTVIYTNADGWSLNRTVMLMQDAYRLNFGFGFDYNRQGADMLFAFPSFYFTSGKRGNMQGGWPINYDTTNSRFELHRNDLSVHAGGQVHGSVNGRQFSLNDNNWTTFGYLYSAQTSPLLIRVVAGHNSNGTYSDFINDTYAYNIADGTTVTIGSTATGSSYSVQLRKVKATNVVDANGRTLIGGGDGGWRYEIARNQSFSMSVSIQIMGVTSGWIWAR